MLARAFRFGLLDFLSRFRRFPDIPFWEATKGGVFTMPTAHTPEELRAHAQDVVRDSQEATTAASLLKLPGKLVAMRDDPANPYINEGDNQTITLITMFASFFLQSGLLQHLFRKKK